MVLGADSGGGMIAVELRLAGGRVHYILTTWLLRCKVLLVSQDADGADAAEAARHDERVGRLCRCRRRGPRVRCESRPEDRVDTGTRRSRPRGECGEQPNMEADVAGLGCLDAWMGGPVRAPSLPSASLGHLKMEEVTACVVHRAAAAGLGTRNRVNQRASACLAAGASAGANASAGGALRL